MSQTRLRPRLTESYWPGDDAEGEIHDTTVAAVLREAVAEAGDQIALVDGSAPERPRWTYSELLEIAERVAKALLSRFSPGERFAIWAPTTPEWVFLEYGCAIAGLTIVTVNPALKAGELNYVLEQSEASGIFLFEEFRGNDLLGSIKEVAPNLLHLREVVTLGEWDAFLQSGDEFDGEFPNVAPQDAAQLQYTSGTTGFPKGALLHHRGITNNARIISRRSGMRPGSPLLCTLPMFHTGGSCCAALGALAMRSALILVRQFDPGLLLDLIASERVGAMPGVPTMFIEMLEHPTFPDRDMSSLHAIWIGGAPVSSHLVERMKTGFDANVTNQFGQTEASPVICMTLPEDSILDQTTTVGRPLPGAAVKIMDQSTGGIAELGAVGEVCVRSWQVMNGYYRMPEETADTIDPEGWLHTGDLGSMDERGYVTIRGRVKDMIIRGGENIHSSEIEDRLADHPAIRHVAVVGIPDERLGETVGAFMTSAPGVARPDADELRAWVRETLAPHKTPAHWVWVDELPLTPTGKIQKHVLRDTYLQGGPS